MVRFEGRGRDFSLATVEPDTPLEDSLGVSPCLLGVDEIETSVENEEDIQEVAFSVGR